MCGGSYAQTDNDFKKVYPVRPTITQNAVCKLLHPFNETDSVTDMPRTGRNVQRQTKKRQRTISQISPQARKS